VQDKINCDFTIMNRRSSVFYLTISERFSDLSLTALTFMTMLFVIALTGFSASILKAQNAGASIFNPMGAAPLNLSAAPLNRTVENKLPQQELRPTGKSLLREFDAKHVLDRVNKPAKPAATGCGNLNFETGDFTGWQGFTGCNPNAGKDCSGWAILCCTGASTPTCCTTAGFPLNIFKIVSTGVDPYGGFPVNAPALPGYTPGTYSCRLGDDSAKGKAQRLITTFTPTASNASFTYQYAAVLENPQPPETTHTSAEMPFFKAFLLDQKGDTITCTNLDFIAGAQGLNFQYSSVVAADGYADVQFQTWVTVSTDLTNYINTPVTITFTTADCAFSGHFGYAYINCECMPLQIAQQDTLCTPFKATLTAPYQDNTTYVWTGPGGPYSGSAIQVFQGGNYNLTMTSTSGCVVKIAHSVIAAQALIDTAFESSPEKCSKNNGMAAVTASGGTGALTYSWNNGGKSDTLTNLAAAVYTVTVTDSRTCSLTSVVTITNITAPPLTATGTGNLNCFTPSVVLTGVSTGNTMAWNGGALSNSGNPATVSAPGTYTVMATDAYGCTAKDTVAVKNSDPTVSVQSVLGTCIGKTDGAIALISAGGGLTYSWSNGDSTKAISGLAPGIYSVTVKDSLGCTVSDSAIVLQYNPIVTLAGAGGSILDGESIQLSAGGGITYLWSPSGSLSDAHVSNPVASPVASTEYIIVVTDAHNCIVIDSVWVDVLNIFVPSAFSPNGDGENEVLYVRGLNGSVGIYFAVYDRWGERVFETTNLANGWDGMFRGRLMDSGVFAWYLKVTFPNEKLVTKTGNVTLMR
jgi:gliding motility-associated-like protein